MSMTRHNLEIDSYLDERGLLFDKFNSICLELGILFLDQNQKLVVSDTSQLDIDDPETQTKLNQLSALYTSLNKALESYNQAQRDSEERKKEIDSQINQMLDDLLNSPQSEIVSTKLSQDDKLNQLEAELKAVVSTAKSEKIDPDKSRLKFELRKTKIENHTKQISDRKKILAKEAVQECPQLSPKIIELDSEIQDARKWSNAEDRKQKLILYGKMGDYNSITEAIQTKYLIDIKGLEFSQPEKLIRDKYFDYLKHSDSGKKINIEAINLGDLRHAYLTSQRKQAELKSLFPDYIQKFITDEHYIKAQSKHVLSDTKQEIQAFLQWLNDENLPKSKELVSQKLKNLGLTFSDKQLDEIFKHVKSNNAVISQGFLESIEALGKYIKELPVENLPSGACFVLGLVSAFCSLITFFASCFTQKVGNIETPELQQPLLKS